MNQFDQETRLQPAGENRYAGLVHDTWNIGKNPNGGYLMALGAAAVRQMHPQHPDPLSVTVQYLRPGMGGQPCEVETELVRAGNSLSTGRARLMQDGKARIEVLAAFGELGADAQTQLTIPPPAIPSPEECFVRSGAAQGVDLPIMQRLDVRLHPGEARPGATGLGQVSGWIRFHDERPPDSMAMLLFADAFPPAVFGLLGMVGWVPTIELTVHVRRRPVPGWIQAQFRTLDLADGRMIEDGWLWDSEGHLIAQSRQLAMLLRK